jgi:uncharacterized protein YcfJ
MHIFTSLFCRILCLFLPFSMGSCATNIGTGIFAGSALGAGVGGISGGGLGALIGSATGLVMGSLTGFALDEQDKKVMEKSSPRTVERMNRNEPLTLNDVIKLSQGGVSDNTIIQYIHDQKTQYNLTQTQIRRLRDAGVSQRVINYMVDTDR